MGYDGHILEHQIRIWKRDDPRWSYIICPERDRGGRMREIFWDTDFGYRFLATG